MDEERQGERGSGGEKSWSEFLEKTASYASYPAGSSADRNVSVYQLLGFYYLLRSGGRNHPFRKYYPVPGKDKEGSGSDYRPGCGDHSGILSGDTAFYIEI